jgi:hypothetical protein
MLCVSFAPCAMTWLHKISGSAQSFSDEKIEAAVISKQYQICSNLAKWKELNSGKVNREFVNGLSFLYFGRNYRLSIVETGDVPLAFKGNQFLLNRDFLKTADTYFRKFYCIKGRVRERSCSHECFRIMAERVGFEPTVAFRPLRFSRPVH